MQEVWVTIPDFEGFYEASNLGWIRSVDRWVKYKHGGKDRFWPSKIIKGYIPKNGYYSVDLKMSGKIHKLMVHKIIGKIFSENGNNAGQINHKDGNKLNNRSDNLEWVSQRQNMRHAFANGLHSGKGETHYRAKKVIDISNGQIFGCVVDLAQEIRIDKIRLYRMLSGKECNGTNFRYL